MEPKRGRKAANFSANSVKIAQQKVSELSKTKAETLSKTAAIQHMKKQIVAARARGVAWSDIAAAMAEGGVVVSARSLKNEIEALNGAKPAKKGVKKVDQKKGQTTPVAASNTINFGSGASFQVRPDRGDDL